MTPEDEAVQLSLDDVLYMEENEEKIDDES